MIFGVPAEQQQCATCLFFETAFLQRLKGSGGQCSDHAPHTSSNWSAWLSSQKEASSIDDAQESLQPVC